MYNLSGLNAKTAEVDKAAELCSKEAHAQNVAIQPKGTARTTKTAAHQVGLGIWKHT